MATFILEGQTDWRLVRDEEGYREYKITHLVGTNDSRDGPANVLRTPGLPTPGAFWIVDNDVDLWAWCRPNAAVNPLITNEPCRIWSVEQIFSNRPPKRDFCWEQEVEDPLLQPQRLSGTFVKKQREAVYDRFGLSIVNSAFEQMRGPQVEFDESNPTVTVEQNVPILNLGLVSAMMDAVNSVPQWGLAPRKIKLSNFTWDRKHYGQCFYYYTRKFEFEVNFNGFDRDMLDEGTKALNGINRNGEWVVLPVDEEGTMPDPTNPNHFVRYKDAHGENCRVILDGFGLPIDPSPGSGSGQGGSEPGTIHIEKYNEANFFLLGIPVTF